MKYYKYKDLENEINEIESLDFRQKEIVLSEIKKYLVDDKLTYKEFELAIHDLRKEFKISQIDEKYLDQLLLAIKDFY